MDNFANHELGVVCTCDACILGKTQAAITADESKNHASDIRWAKTIKQKVMKKNLTEEDIRLLALADEYLLEE
jgi:hypothetical protein